MLIYVASPYYHQELDVMNDRAEMVAKYAAHLLARDKTCYSPIAHGHAIQEHLPEISRGDHRFWLKHDFPFVVNSTECHFLNLEGLKESRGCRWEFETCQAFGIDCFIVDPDDYENITSMNRESVFK